MVAITCYNCGTIYDDQYASFHQYGSCPVCYLSNTLAAQELQQNEMMTSISAAINKAQGLSCPGCRTVIDTDLRTFLTKHGKCFLGTEDKFARKKREILAIIKDDSFYCHFYNKTLKNTGLMRHKGMHKKRRDNFKYTDQTGSYEYDYFNDTVREQKEMPR